MSTSSTLPNVYSSSVPPLQFTEAGIIAPSDADILAGKQEDINYAFGGGLNSSLKTPQGQLATSDAATISDKNDAILFLASQFDPQYATGRYQDALAAIYFLYRKPAAGTVVTCIIGGVPNTAIPAGTLAQDSAGNTYKLLGDIVIPASSQIVSTWQNVVTGPIECPEGTLIEPLQTIDGWDTITNPADGVTGRDVETPNEFEYRRKNSVAANAQGIAAATYGTVSQVDGVLDTYVYDNGQPITVYKGYSNFPILQNSIYVCVVGGTDADVANAILNKKSGGCNYTGNTTVPVLDSNYSYPEPQYNVSFQRATPLPIFFAVQIAADDTLPGDISDQIKNAILARFNGEDGTARERIGSLILAARYYSAVLALNSSLVVLNITVGLAANPTGTNQGVGIERVPTLDASAISVTSV